MSKLSKVNTEQSLYVLEHPQGYTTLGFDYADQRAREVATWAKRPDLVPTASKGTADHYAQYQAAMSAGAEYHKQTRERCPAELVPQLIGLEGKRVEVVDKYGEKRRFWVGKSTGWMPCHLEINNTRSTGGPAVMGAPFKSVRVIR